MHYDITINVGHFIVFIHVHCTRIHVYPYEKKLYGTYMSTLYVKYRGHIIVKYMSHICILNVNEVEDI